MNDLNDFFKVMAEGKKTDPKAIAAKEIKEHIKGDLGELFSQLSEVKSQDPKYKQSKKIEEQVKESVKTDLGSLFAELASLKAKREEIIEQNPELVESVAPVTEEVLIEVAPIETPIGEVPPEQHSSAISDLPELDKWLRTPKVSEPTNSENDFAVINKKIKFLEQWIGKIDNAGPGSGEVNLRYLDDVARETIADGRYLKYNDSTRKFEFDEVNPHDVVYNTTLVDGPTYTALSTDYYIGVNYNGPVTITLETSPNSGHKIIIKDESGNASTNPITVVGNVDNDPGGFILQMDNGGVQMIYRAGWRII